MNLNLSAYQFKSMPDELDALKNDFKEKARVFGIKGTILLSPEGINLNIAGTKPAVLGFKTYLVETLGLHDMPLKYSESEDIPFRRMKIKIKKEIITFRRNDIHPLQRTVPHLSPLVLKKWFDEKKEFIMLDVRNDYETVEGHFFGARFFNIENFTEFTEAVSKNFSEADKEKTIVTYCTGGVRCEKAGPAMTALGFKSVYQLDGGILNYFEQCGAAHWEGDCFVFDERHALTPALEAVS